MVQSMAIALVTGMLATVNPCGFALLPAYLSTFLGLEEDRSRSGAVVRALAVSMVLTLGFITVFGLLGLVINSLVSSIQDYLYAVTIAVGIILIGFGVLLVAGRNITLAIPKLNKGGDNTLVGMYLFGVSYAIASLSCTIGPFIGATSATFTTRGFLAGLLGFVMYGVGMGLIVAVLTVAVALAKNGVVQRFRQLLPMINKIAGAVMIVAGAYVAYYGWYEIQLLVLDRSVEDDPIIDAGFRMQTWLANLLPTADQVWWWVLGIVVLIGGFFGFSRLRSEPVRDDAPAS